MVDAAEGLRLVIAGGQERDAPRGALDLFTVHHLSMPCHIRIVLRPRTGSSLHFQSTAEEI